MGNTKSDEIRPFTYHASEAELDDLRRRIRSARLPEKETVSDFSQGVPLATIQKLARYWATEYDWRKLEARLNAVPNFTTEIDGLDIHFIHARSKHEDALPLIVSHGWPGSIIEQLKLIGPLTDPTAHGGTEADAFHVVIPSMPGYGFSGKPDNTGWGPEHIARAWDILMKRLGYTRYAAQGRRLGRRLGRRPRRGPHGRTGTAGIAGHSHQHAPCRAACDRLRRARRRTGSRRALN
jgi:pimeloyl-ACP methyl ester carboxylesterase